jgi:Fe2+ transport system protein B
MTTDIIKFTKPDTTVAFEPFIVVERDNLRDQASTIQSVTTDVQNDFAVRTAQGIKRLLKSIEKDEKKTRQAYDECKEVVHLELQKFTAVMVQEYNRLVELTAAYDRERMEKMRKEEEAIRLRIAANLAAETKAKEEAEAALRLARSEEASMAAISAALEAADRAESLKVAAEEAIRAPLPTVERAQGQIRREVVRWEITDLEKVYAAKPHWFERVVKRSVVNAEVSKDFVLDGLRVWTEVEHGIRV